MSHTSESIQPLTASGCQVAYSIHQSCHISPWQLSTFQDCLSNPYFAIQYMHDERSLGYAIGLLVADEVTLMDIGVERTCRGKGVGTRLLSDFVEIAGNKGAKDIWLEVRASNNPAIQLYIQKGFAQIERRKNYYPTEGGREDALIMHLPIRSI